MEARPLVPEEAYTFQPVPYVGVGNRFRRWIYYQIEFTPAELEALAALKVLMSHELTSQPLPAFFTDNELIRIINAMRFDLKKSLTALRGAIDWRTSRVGRSFLQESYAEALLAQGGMYLHGIDHRFCPLIVLNVARMNLQQSTLTQYTELLCYVLEYTIAKHMVPGHVENWVVLADLGRQSMMKLPWSQVRDLVSILQNNFKCRLVAAYVVNAPTTISFLWNIVKKMIDPMTADKVHITKHGVPEKIQSHFMPHQLEAKYGGTAAEVTQFWPPVMPGPPYYYQQPGQPTISAYSQL